MSDTFGEVQFDQQEVAEDGTGVFHRVDPAPYREFILALSAKPAGTQATVKVATGPIVQKGKSSRGRGKSELSDARSFQMAASELGHGLRVGWRHNVDGTTSLRMMLQPKREFSPETVAKRTLALETRRLENAKARLAKDPLNAELKQKVQTIETRMKAAANGQQQVQKPATQTAKK